MRRAELATYIAVGLSAVVYLIRAVTLADWLSAFETAIWASIMSWLAYTLGRRHQAWAAVVLMALLVFGVIVRTLDTGRPPFVILVAVLIYLYFGAFRAAREYPTLRDLHAEPRSSG